MPDPDATSWTILRNAASGDQTARGQFALRYLPAGRTFSSVVAEARRLGFTEPDPRDDLSGMDAARKAVILAREMGESVEISDVVVESLVPAALRDVSDADAFIAGLAAYDEHMEQLRAAAEVEGERLRHTVVVEPGSAPSVGLRRYAHDHAFATIRAADNIIAFTTERYRERPLIVQGPGAGPEVTAGGVFADLLRLASYLGGPS